MIWWYSSLSFDDSSRARNALPQAQCVSREATSLRRPYAKVTHWSNRYGAQYAAVSSTVTSPHGAPYVHRQRTMGPSVPMAVCARSSPTFCSEVNVRYEAGG